MNAGAYTTGAVAAILGVDPRTVRRWMDAGRLRGFRLPGDRGDRRVTRAALEGFARGRTGHAGAIERGEEGR